MKQRIDKKQLSQFGLLVGGIFAAIGLWPMILRGEGPRPWALAIGVLLVVAALMRPHSLTGVHRAWMGAGEALGWINTRILLSMVFYGLVTPMGIVMRLIGRDPMRRHLEPGVATYRVPKPSRPAIHMTRQF